MSLLYFLCVMLDIIDLNGSLDQFALVLEVRKLRLYQYVKCGAALYRIRVNEGQEHISEKAKLGLEFVQV